ncbi:MAG: efflux RND transporter permease subunit [Planctomycetota bacterium]|nr:efflux RND transporter permease subunit [Planctomycetota bacterium]
MFDRLIRFSLDHRPLVLFLAVVCACGGLWELARIPMDVFPDLNRPTVAIMTEAPGLAPEEVELLVTRPLEYAMNGLTGVERIRSASGIGLSIVWVEFGWGTEIYRDRQIVFERLATARERMAAGTNPTIAPVSSIMGEILLLGIRPSTRMRQVGGEDPSKERELQMAMRTFGEFRLRNRLMSIQGVSQVTVMGGILKQYQVVTSPERLASQNITLGQLSAAIEKANVLSGGGLMVRDTEESILRISGQSLSLSDIEETPVIWREQRPVLVREVADVRFGGPIQRGDAAVRVRDTQSNRIEGGQGVILAVQKQPGVDTLVLDRKIQLALDSIQLELPEGMELERRLFQQSSFIASAVSNVSEAVQDGAIWVVVILFVFLWNFRVSICSLIAMPLSILMTFLVFRYMGATINTMTLGGIAVAIGDLVDDSIVDVENIFRRLKENQQRIEGERQRPLEVVYQASREVRGSIVYATMIVVLVVIPLFGLSGLEGRIFAPLGVSYIVSLVCSLLVSLTVTPVVASYLLPRAQFLLDQRETIVVRGLKAIVRRVLEWTLDHTGWVFGATALGVLLSIVAVSWMGGSFLPEFHEGSYTVNLQCSPGSSLQESRRVAQRCEQMLLEIPEVVSLSRRTGRAELDEHAEGVHSSEIDIQTLPSRVALRGFWPALARRIPGLQHLGYRVQGRPSEKVIEQIRDTVTRIPGVQVNIGQPISHRLDHIMSGVRAQIAVKAFGEDLRQLREFSHDILDAIGQVPGVVDLQAEPQVEISQIRLQIKRQEAARYGLSPGDLADLLQTAYKGRIVSQVLDGEQFHDLVVWYDEESRSSPERIQSTILDTPSGRRVSLGQVAEVLDTTGPNTIHREGVQRRIVVQCNVQGRDLSSVVHDIQARLKPTEERMARLAGSYRLEVGGQFEAQQQANARLALFGSLAIIAIVLLLYQCLNSWSAAFQILVNVPLAAIGAVAMLLWFQRPDPSVFTGVPWWSWPIVWVQSITLSVAHWVGFITLLGIVSRNGILMISHYQHLMKYEAEAFSKEMIIRGSLERLTPVMMTAFTSFVGLLPLLMGADESGKEILHPLSVVVFGGMLSSTILDQLVTPALYWRFGDRSSKRPD